LTTRPAYSTCIHVGTKAGPIALPHVTDEPRLYFP
jgi:hypothetical protein